MDLGRLVGSKRALATPGVMTITNTATLAQIIAGKTLLPGFPGTKYKVLDFWMIPDGTFTTATSIDLESTNAAPVKIGVQAIAGAGNNVYIWPGHANMVLGAGFGVELGVGDGIRIMEVGSTLAGGVNILIAITFQIIIPELSLKAALGADQQ